MTRLSIAQLQLLLQNQTDPPLHRYIPANKLLVSFLHHLHEFFIQTGASFQNLQPVLVDAPYAQQETSLMLNGIELGELFLLQDSSLGESSLVYFSPYGTIESTLLHLHDYEEYLLSDYIVLLREFAFHIYGEFLLYQELESPPPSLL